MPPPRRPYDWTGVCYSSADHNVSSLFKRFDDAASTEICVRRNYSMLWLQEVPSVFRQGDGTVVRVKMWWRLAVFLQAILHSAEEVIARDPGYTKVVDALLFQLVMLVSNLDFSLSDGLAFEPL